MSSLALVIVSVLGGAPTDAAVEHAVEVYRCDFSPSVDYDYDGWPDGWTRRRGGEYYEFLKIGLETDAAGRGALRVGLNGGAAAVFVPAVEISSRFSYVLEADIRTEGVRYEGAYVLLSLYDSLGNILEKHASPIVSSAAEWQTVKIGPITPGDARASQAVISLHVEPQARRHDLDGSVWYSNLRMSRLPRITLRAGNEAHLFTSLSDVEVACELSGITERSAEISFELYDIEGRQLATHRDRLVFSGTAPGPTAEWRSPDPAAAGVADGYVGRAKWRPNLPGFGFYRVFVSLHGEGRSALARSVTLVVVPPATRSSRGEFGWSLAAGESPYDLGPLANLLGEAGAHWVKYPLWFSDQDTAAADKLAWFAERLSLQHIELVGILDRLPTDPASTNRPLGPHFIADALGDAQVWKAALNPVMTRLSLKVRYWQLGDDNDFSLVGYPALPSKIAEIKAHMRYFSPETHVGFGWRWLAPRLPVEGRPWEFLSLASDPPLTAEEIGLYLTAPPAASLPAAKGAAAMAGRDTAWSRSKVAPSGESGIAPPNPATPRLVSRRAAPADLPRPPQQWLLLEPLPRGQYDLVTRARDLVMRMVAAKVHAADAVFVPHPFDDERGLMNRDGTPGELLLPWRTTALALAGTQYLGSWQLPGGSANHVFVRDGKAIMVLWNDIPTKERMYFGEELVQLDMWGQVRRPATTVTDDFPEQEVEATPLPTFLIGLSEAVARWQVALAFDRPSLESVFGRDQVLHITCASGINQGISGSLTLSAPNSWIFDRAPRRFKLAEGEDLKHPLRIVLQQDANSGPQKLWIDVDMTADRNYRFRVYRTLQLGLDDVKIEMTTRLREDGNLIVEQHLTNLTDGFMSFQSVLFPPGRRRETRQVMNLGRGKNTVTFMLPHGEELIGQKLWLRAEEIGGSRILNYTVTVER
jgi:hypothetical protein